MAHCARAIVPGPLRLGALKIENEKVVLNIKY